MKYEISSPNTFIGNIALPASKSISNRALILHALAGGKASISNLSDCDDTRVVVAALSSDGNRFDIGAAGTAMRFLTAYYANKEGEWEITGSTRMKQRPIKILVDALRDLGAEIDYLENDGFPPLRIRGKALDGGKIALAGNVSSQYISALLMIAPCLKNGITLTLTGDIISQPYIWITLRMMETFGIAHKWEGNVISVAPQSYQSVPYMVESDWSAASYWYQMLALSASGEVFLYGLMQNSLQGDSKVATIFNELGIATEYEEKGVRLRKTGNVTAKLVYDFVEQPDLAQTFVSTCCLLDVPFSFSGLQSLKIKETNRIEALMNEMRKLGFVLTEPTNGMLEWNGEKVVADEMPVIKTYDDHRMAMAFAPVALKRGKICIANPEVVSKSYPTYWDDLKCVGFEIKEIIE